MCDNDVIDVKSCDYFRTADKTISKLARLGFINEEDAINYSKNKKLLKRESLENYVVKGNLQAAGKWFKLLYYAFGRIFKRNL